jgi:hypothetical protein
VKIFVVGVAFYATPTMLKSFPCRERTRSTFEMALAEVNFTQLIRAEFVQLVRALRLAYQIKQRLAGWLAMLIMRMPDKHPIRVVLFNWRRDYEPSGQFEVQLADP